MTTDIRAESVALLAEAAHALCIEDWSRLPEGIDITMHGVDAHERMERHRLAASPTLHDAIALGLAWQRVEAALPEGWAINMLWGTVTEDRWGAHAGPFPVIAGQYRHSVTTGGPTPTAALLALVEKLEATR